MTVVYQTKKFEWLYESTEKPLKAKESSREKETIWVRKRQLDMRLRWRVCAMQVDGIYELYCLFNIGRGIDIEIYVAMFSYGGQCWTSYWTQPEIWWFSKWR